MLRHFYDLTPKQRPPLLIHLTRTATVIVFSSTVGAPAFISPNLEQCKSVANAKLLHQQILIQGLTHMSSRVVSGYINVGAPSHGLLLLERIAPCSYSVFSWNMLIRRSVHFGFYEEVLEHFQRMMRLGWRPDHYTYPFVLKACGELPSFRRAASVHGVVYVNGFEWNVFVCNTVVAMYGRCGELNEARKEFDEIVERDMVDLVSWNSIVAAYVHAGYAKRALKLFDRMIDDATIRPDVISLVNVLPALATMSASLQGRQVHGFAIRRGLFEDIFVGNAVLDMYAKCGMLDETQMVVDRMEFKDVVSWNAMVTGYSQVGKI